MQPCFCRLFGGICCNNLQAMIQFILIQLNFFKPAGLMARRQLKKTRIHAYTSTQTQLRKKKKKTKNKQKCN